MKIKTSGSNPVKGIRESIAQTKVLFDGRVMEVRTWFLLLRFERDVIEFITKLQIFCLISRVFTGRRVDLTVRRL